MALDKFTFPGAPTCRVVYPYGFFEKTKIKGAPDSKPSYNGWIAVPKADKEKVDFLKERFKEAFKALQARGFKGTSPKAIKPDNNCLVDGDDYAELEEGRDNFRGFYFVKCKSANFNPMVTDRHKRLITNGKTELASGVNPSKLSPEELQDGDYILVNMSFWVYSNVSDGIGANCHAIVRVKKGEQIGGSQRSIDDLIDLESYELPDESEDQDVDPFDAGSLAVDDLPF